MTITVRKMLDKAAATLESADLFYGHGTDNAYDEAVTLVFYVLKLAFDCEESMLDRAVTESEKVEIERLISARIKTRKPLSYLTHEAYFCGLKFYVDERVIVPRSPFAELIQNQFEPWVDPEKIKNILDLCTGSSCIPIACAYYFPETQIDASELSEDALAVAEINIKQHGVQDRVHLIQSDVFKNIPLKQYDLIISNPPYVSSDEMKTLPEEFLHEPNMSLETPNEGLFIVDQILKQAAQYLTEEGVLIIEVGNTEEALEKRYPNVPFLWLEFEYGGGGVFLLTKKALEQFF
jgi:ribosomal protein L3 glutamine methyltransferase